MSSRPPTWRLGGTSYEEFATLWGAACWRCGDGFGLGHQIVEVRIFLGDHGLKLFQHRLLPLGRGLDRRRVAAGLRSRSRARAEQIDRAIHDLGGLLVDVGSAHGVVENL